MAKERKPVSLKWKLSKPAEADVHAFSARVVLPSVIAREMAVYCQSRGITTNDFVSLSCQDVLRNDKAFRKHLKENPSLLDGVELGKQEKKKPADAHEAAE